MKSYFFFLIVETIDILIIFWCLFINKEINLKQLTMNFRSLLKIKGCFINHTSSRSLNVISGPPLVKIPKAVSVFFSRNFKIINNKKKISSNL